jgi:threonine/homoserine/homoserine lactone efflux protein
METLIPFMLASLVLVVIPGPAVMYIVTRGVTQGRAAAVVSTLGVETGMLVHIGAAAAGVSALIARTAVTFTTLKLVGAAYLVWLAISALRGHGVEEDAAAPRERSLGRLYAHGFAISALNPKVAVFFVAFFPQFVDPSRGSILGQTLVLGAVFLVIATLSDLAYALLSGTVGARVRGLSTGAARWGRYVQGAVYAALAFAVATSAADADG